MKESSNYQGNNHSELVAEIATNIADIASGESNGAKKPYCTPVLRDLGNTKDILEILGPAQANYGAYYDNLFGNDHHYDMIFSGSSTDNG